MQLTYYLQHDNNSYEAFYTYRLGTIDRNEIYARQLCEYFIVNGTQYQLLSNEMNEQEEILIVKDIGLATTLEDERIYDQNNVCIEFREYHSHTYMPLLYTLQLSHWEVIRYLLKDYIQIPTVGIRKRDSTEIDEDRRCYVIYVTTDKI